jgi:hypothetical protein
MQESSREREGLLLRIAQDTVVGNGWHLLWLVAAITITRQDGAVVPTSLSLQADRKPLWAIID